MAGGGAVGTGGSYEITGKAGPMNVTGTACSLLKPFKTHGVGGATNTTTLALEPTGPC